MIGRQRKTKLLEVLKSKLVLQTQYRRNQPQRKGVEMSDKWRHRKIRSIRVSEALEEMIEQECQRRNLDFSSFMRYAAIAACHHQHSIAA